MPSTSLWLSTEHANRFNQLDTNLQVDVCIIGGGIAGLTIAHQLCRAEKFVALIDAGDISSGESGRTTAHLSNALDDRYYNIEKLHGQENAKIAAQSHTEAIHLIEKIVQENNIDCDFTRLDGYLFLAPDSDDELLQKELDAAHRAGLTDVELLKNLSVQGFSHGPCLRFPQQAQFHPMKYLTCLAQMIAQKGGKIYTQTRAIQIEPGAQTEIKTNTGHTIIANHVVIATNAPVYDKSFLFAKQEPYRTYVIGARIPKNSLALGLYWDTTDPYHYVRLQADSHSNDDILIIGGADHRVGKSPEDPFSPFLELEAWARGLFPQIIDISYRWSGQILEPSDYLAYIGRMPVKDANFYVVTGDSGNGMTHGTIAGMLISDLICGINNPWEKLYSPSRSPLKNLKDFSSHNISAVSSYLDYLTPGEVNSIEEIKAGEGKIIRDGLKKLAVYRDKNGELHECSAICTHLQGILTWNAVEKSWDCPAHGSRFSTDGVVLNGPAICPLETRRVDKEA